MHAGTRLDAYAAMGQTRATGGLAARWHVTGPKWKAGLGLRMRLSCAVRRQELEGLGTSSLYTYSHHCYPRPVTPFLPTTRVPILSRASRRLLKTNGRVVCAGDIPMEILS